MIALRLVLMILALCCFVVAGFGVSAPRVNLTSLGLAFWILAEIIR